MIHRLKKTIFMTVSSSQKLSEMRYDNYYVMELKEKWVLFYDVIWRGITNKCQNCHMSVCSKFSQLCFCQISFELVYSWESYHKNKKGELFIETQCINYKP